jgi:hypothetical protein
MAENGNESTNPAGGWPAREEWDFSLCPIGRENDCWHYEFARECQWILDEFVLQKKEKARFVEGKWPSNGFDRRGNWHFHHYESYDERQEWALAFFVPLGFPEKAYLKTSQTHYEPPVMRGLKCLNPPFWDFDEMSKELGSRSPFRKREDGHSIFIDWQITDKEIMALFKEWLKRNRKRPPLEYRGRSRPKQQLADLKALGAHRLLRHGTAEAGLAYTGRFIKSGLYAKISDWYEAKARALKVLKNSFQYQKFSVAGKILAEERGLR